MVVLAFPLPIMAAEWSAEPRISLRSGYNDNIRLTTADHDSVWESILSPSVNFGLKKENQGLSGSASASVRRYSGGSGRDSSNALDREDYYMKTNAYHRTERDDFGAFMDYTRDSTLDSELDETGNVIDQRATRDRFTLGPSWSRTLNEKTRLNLGYQFTTIRYSDDPGVTDLVEYDYNIFSSSLVHQFTPRIQGTLSASYSSYKPDTGFDSDTLNIQAGLSRNFSETLVASFLAGRRETTSDTLIGSGFCIGADQVTNFPECTGGFPVPTGLRKDETDSSGSVYSASVTNILETGSLGASLSRVTNPGSQGELLDTTRLILSGERRITETFGAKLQVEYNERETIVNRIGRETNQGKRRLLRVRPRISWRWQQEWELAGEYEYVENQDENSETATRNAIYVTLIYRPTRINISR